MKSNIIKISILLLISLFQNKTTAQSTDPDNPTALTEGKLTIAASSERQSYYYTITASGGEVKFTGDGLGKFSYFDIQIQDEDFKTLKFSNFAAKTPLERTVLRVNIKQPQKLILKITAPKETNTSLKLRIEGAVSFDSNSSSSTASNNSQSSNNPPPSTTTQTNGDNSSTTAQDSTQQGNNNTNGNSNNTNNDNSQGNSSQQNTEEGTASTAILVTLKSGTTTEGGV
jgi:hypothetical protein